MTSLKWYQCFFPVFLIVWVLVLILSPSPDWSSHKIFKKYNYLIDSSSFSIKIYEKEFISGMIIINDLECLPFGTHLPRADLLDKLEEGDIVLRMDRDSNLYLLKKELDTIIYYDYFKHQNWTK